MNILKNSGVPKAIPLTDLVSGVAKKAAPRTRWETINWASVQKKVFKYQKEIYKASKNNSIEKVRVLQNCLIKSYLAKLVAVRRVTQDNQRSGRSTAGVDGVRKLSPVQRLQMVDSLHFPLKPSPLLRVWVPKPGKPEKRPLGIPTLKDRALQALFKLALEPEWEARFEENSFGFRPGRRPHDALVSIRNHMQKRSKYIVDADISKCFDGINHSALLDKIGMHGKFRTQIKYWLEAGVLDNGVFQETIIGTPQGGVISPLLANIALHGMEKHLKDFIKDFRISDSSGKKIDRNRVPGTLAVIRYADDFVIMHADKWVALKCLEEVKSWLSRVGLEISESKTRLSHTLKLTANDSVVEGFDGKVGFDFLGFTVKQFPSKNRSAKSPSGTPLGYYSLIYPSKNAVNTHQAKLHDIVLKQGKSFSQKDLINRLNPVIRGWSNYFGISDANTVSILSKMDYLLYLKIRRWARRVKGTTGKASSFFHRVGSRKWVFSLPVPFNTKLLSHIDYYNPILGYVKIKGIASIFDGNEVYWSKRLEKNPYLSKRVSSLLKSQKGKCNFCHLSFLEGDVLEVDHVIPLRFKGKDEYPNLQLLHGHCHDQKTASESKIF